jgi:hypothetical protein
MRPGQAERRTPDYRRHGTINLFAALDAKAGTVIGEFHQRHRAVEFRSFLATVEAAVPGERKCCNFEKSVTEKAPRGTGR